MPSLHGKEHRPTRWAIPLLPCSAQGTLRVEVQQLCSILKSACFPKAKYTLASVSWYGLFGRSSDSQMCNPNGNHADYGTSPFLDHNVGHSHIISLQCNGWSTNWELWKSDQLSQLLLLKIPLMVALLSFL